MMFLKYFSIYITVKTVAERKQTKQQKKKTIVKNRVQRFTQVRSIREPGKRHEVELTQGMKEN